MTTSITSATSSLPFFYRLSLTILEPIAALSGVMMAFFSPQDYISTMTRDTAVMSSETRFLYTELGGMWLFLAFVEAVVLRQFDDLRLWRVLCAGMVVSDLVYCHSAAQAVGGWGPWLVLSDWTLVDFGVFMGSAPFLTVKILVALGVGVKTVPGWKME